MKRLEKIMRQCDTIVTNPNGYEGLQIRAMNVLIRAIQVCYKVVNDIEVEKLEQELEEIEREEKAITGEKGPGYRLDEDPTP